MLFKVQFQVLVSAFLAANAVRALPIEAEAKNSTAIEKMVEPPVPFVGNGNGNHHTTVKERDYAQVTSDVKHHKKSKTEKHTTHAKVTDHAKHHKSKPVPTEPKSIEGRLVYPLEHHAGNDHPNAENKIVQPAVPFVGDYSKHHTSSSIQEKKVYPSKNKGDSGNRIMNTRTHSGDSTYLAQATSLSAHKHDRLSVSSTGGGSRVVPYGVLAPAVLALLAL